MKYSFFLLLIICCVFQACYDGNRHADSQLISGQSFAADTALVNKILLELKDDNSVPADSMMKSLKEAQELCKRSGYKEGMANVLFQIGNISFWKNSYLDALKHYEEALKITEKIEDTQLHAMCLERMGSVHLATDDPHLALNLYYESLVLSEKISDSSGIAKVYNFLGAYEGQSGQYDSGVAYLNKAIVLNEKLKNRTNRNENLGNLAYLYQTNGKTTEAREIYYSLIAELRAADDMVNLPVIYYNLGSLHQGLDHIDSAYFYLRKAAGIARETRDTAILSTVYGNIGEIMLNEEKLDSARYYLEKCLKYATITDDVETQSEAVSFLIRIDTLSGKVHEAYMHYNQFLTLQDSVYHRKMRHSKEALELNYENDKKKSLIESQQITIQAARKDRLLYVLLLILAILGLVLTIIIFSLKHRNHLKGQKLYEVQLLMNEIEIDRFQKIEEINKLKIERFEEDIRIKERELASIALGIEQKMDLLNLISAKLKDSVGTKKATTYEKTLNEIIGSIKMQLNESDNNDQFNQRFAMLHQEFFPNLKKIHPELTKTEIKFCAYLRINLSGNQIAKILNVTNEAIRKTRYRIRKKMNLPPEGSLEDYISRF